MLVVVFVIKIKVLFFKKIEAVDGCLGKYICEICAENAVLSSVKVHNL